MTEPQLWLVALSLAAAFAVLGLFSRVQRRHRPWRLDRGHGGRGPHGH